MSDAMIEIEGLTKRFGPLVAVDGLSFTVSRGEVMGFLGPNGAGKSTTMKMITGYLAPNDGKIRVMGRDVVAEPIAVKSLIGYLPEGAPAYPDMTPRQFLNFIADVRGLKGTVRRNRIERAVDEASVGVVLDQSIDTLSKGFKRRVGLAQAILHDPPILIMDEPTDGLDPNQKHEVRQLIRAMARDKAIVISTHILEEVEAVCSRAIVIDRGKIVADGTPADLIARSAHHNAVHLAVPAGLGDAVRATLSGMANVDRVEDERSGPGDVAFIAFPRDGMPIIAEIGVVAREQGWEVHRLDAESGRLDDVFRTLTTGETAPARRERAA